MNEQSAAFLKRLLATFRVEAEELVRTMADGLAALDENPEPARRAELVEAFFRDVHSFKGAARAVERGEMEQLCQAAEDVLAAAKEGRIELAPSLVGLLHAMVERLEALLADIDHPPSAADRAGVADLARRIEAAAGAAIASAPTTSARVSVAPVAEPAPAPAGGAPALARHVPSEAERTPPPPERPRPSDAASTVRIQVGRLDAVLYQAEALLAAKLAARARQAELTEVREAFARHRRARAKVLPDLRLLQRRLERGAGEATGRALGPHTQQLRRLLAWLRDEEAFVRGFDARLGALARSAGQGTRALGSQVDGLLDDVKRALMLPISAVLETLAKVVRDLAREQGKEVAFHAVGGELEIDRRVLEEVRDPLMHLVRNSLDHGIETPEVRAAHGKPRRSNLTVAVSQLEGSRIEIRVADDGAGIDLARLRASAQKLGLPLSADEEQLAELVFESGVSTSPLVTDISGRGLGLAIVRDKVERLGGSVTVSSQPGLGTTFRLVLPLSLATFRGVRVQAAGEEFIFPSMGLERVQRVRREEVTTLESQEVIRIDGEAVALVRLADLLGIPEGGGEERAMMPVVVSGNGERRIAFQVDEVIGEQEVLVKSLGRQLRRVPNIAGATVLGNGRVVPILYLPDLTKSARQASGLAGRRPARAPRPERKSILVAEDSITSRILLKGILESAGYRVTTAVDGVDAYTRLHTEPFDLLVSDVDMPRMGGFDLTARVRADRRLADLPVVLVTALDSPRDKERGADVGANAYLVKSGFDQDNLLAAVRRLL